MARGNVRRRAEQKIREFLQSQATAGVLLFIAAVAALVWANSPAGHFYEELLHYKLGLTIAGHTFALSIGHWVNDGLMVLFFLVVGLEIKRELLVGELSSWDRAALPVVAAAGGMIFPALIYTALNFGGPGADGWGVPMATDIAFAIGVLSLFGKRVPLGLKVFLLALAIADDLGAVAVIALFYTDQINIGAAIMAVAGLVVMYVLGRVGMRRPVVYMVLAFIVWLGVLMSGVHATIAGVLVALVVPVRTTISPQRFWEDVRHHLDALGREEVTSMSMVERREQFHRISAIRDNAIHMQPPGLVLEEFWTPIQAYIILPLFALCNAGVVFDSGFVGLIASPISLGVILGLVVGKYLGITLMSWLAVTMRMAQLPQGVDWKQIQAVALMAGIGFTMALFISNLAFASEEQLRAAKTGILIGSTIAAIAGAWLLARALAGREVAKSEEPPAEDEELVSEEERQAASA